MPTTHTQKTVHLDQAHPAPARTQNCVPNYQQSPFLALKLSRDRHQDPQFGQPHSQRGRVFRLEVRAGQGLCRRALPAAAAGFLQQPSLRRRVCCHLSFHVAWKRRQSTSAWCFSKYCSMLMATRLFLPGSASRSKAVKSSKSTPFGESVRLNEIF